MSGCAAQPQLTAVRFLFDRQAEHHLAAAVTPMGRAWRRRRIARSSYTRAFN
ncbi:hypothetical protein [Streptomyces yaizuensis]|uniref:Uncharacterized protein n=1 Tax=Streptomyces yaizuensis TaxID=2989713 RepID=A0ABQ5P6R3_9ACTN|nr:hypothetical protein [Streptomyces sp. YSPA8]GLF98275.1 hypothetical protein SYYSPA8_28280 [Streptomyces sp. YSPA8]